MLIGSDADWLLLLLGNYDNLDSKNKNSDWKLKLSGCINASSSIVALTQQTDFH